MKNTTVKKTLLPIVALLLCVTVLFAACSGKAFKPVTAPAAASVDEADNGGIAVKYGEWLYYINGYQSDVTAQNDYVDVTGAPRVGSVVRIKLADINELFKIKDDKDVNDADDQIAKYVREHAETVVPRFYYNGNTTTTQFNGLYIFGDRLYITTPNDQLTAGGSTLTNQLVLKSYKLDGSDEQSHFTFTGNNVQIRLLQQDGKVVGTYVLDSIVYKLDVASGTSTQVTVDGEDEVPDADNTYSSINWDVAGKCLFFVDKYQHICKLNFGADKYQTVVSEEGNYVKHEHDGETHLEADRISYTISSVNNGQVYYTRTDSQDFFPSGESDNTLYWADGTKSGQVALYKNDTSAKAWKDGKMVLSKSISSDGSTYYGIFVTESADGSQKPVAKLIPAYNDSSVTVSRVEGDIVYYTAGSFSYKLDLNSTGTQEGTPYAKSLGSATGWAAPDFVDVDSTHYIITAGSGGTLSVTRFDPADKNKTQSSVSILLTAEPQEEE